MGLDWMPGRKPRQGHEAEFLSLQKSLNSWFCWRRPRKERRIEEITVEPEETLGAPIVGREAVATEWAREMFEKRADKALDLDAWLKKMDGLRVVDLVRPCDGLPLYSNGGVGQYIGAESFRAQFLKDCVEIIGEEQLDSCYVEKDPKETVAFADLLERSALAFAAAKEIDIAKVDGAEDPDSPEFRVSVVLSAARWCRFWGNSGHGLAPWF